MLDCAMSHTIPIYLHVNKCFIHTLCNSSYLSSLLLPPLSFLHLPSSHSPSPFSSPSFSPPLIQHLVPWLRVVHSLHPRMLTDSLLPNRGPAAQVQDYPSEGEECRYALWKLYVLSWSKLAVFKEPSSYHEVCGGRWEVGGVWWEVGGVWWEVGGVWCVVGDVRCKL